MVIRFIWGIFWRVGAFLALVAAGLWWGNRPPEWNGEAVLAANDTKIEGRAGLIVVALAQPEKFAPKFFENFVEKLFTQVIPWPVNALVGGDNGVVLVDPGQPYMIKRHTPHRLADIWGREADVDGIRWVEKYRRGQLRWEKPSATARKDFGYYLYPARRQGMRTPAAKAAVKARYLYYAQLPGGVLPHYRQTVDFAQGAVAEAQRRYPIVAGAMADAFDPYAKEQAVTRVLDAGVDTLILASAQPIYSRFEELGGSFVGVHKIVEKWRKAHGNKPVKIVIAPWLATQPAYEKLILDHFAETVPQASVPGEAATGILSLHGLPVSLASSDGWSGRSAALGKRLIPQAEAILRAKGYARVKVALGSEAFADGIEDPGNKIVSVNELYRQAIAAGDAVAVAVPLEFLAENTDSLFGHQVFFFNGLPGYRDYNGPPATVDWSKPYVRRLQSGKTLILYAGAPGGLTVPRQSAALADAIGTVFRHEPTR